MNTCFCLCQHKLHAFSLGLDIYLVHLSYPPSPKSGNTPPPRLPTALTPKASPSKSNWFCWSRHCTETPVRDSSNQNQIGQYRFTSGRKKQTINPKSTTTKQFQTSARSSAPPPTPQTTFKLRRQHPQPRCRFPTKLFKRCVSCWIYSHFWVGYCEQMTRGSGVPSQFGLTQPLVSCLVSDWGWTISINMCKY